MMFRSVRVLLHLMTALIISLIIILSYSAVECYNIFHTCVEKFGSNGTGCSLSLTCCSTMSGLVLDLNSHCDSSGISQSRQIVANRHKI
jgi:hypothetical protein